MPFLALWVSCRWVDELYLTSADEEFDDEPRQDGIHRDGSFLQHNGILYNGNYGKDLVGDRWPLGLIDSSMPSFSSRGKLLGRPMRRMTPLETPLQRIYEGRNG